MSNLQNGGLVFSSEPEFVLATNRFVRCPIVLQVDDVRLISLVQQPNVPRHLRIPIFHSDGTQLAVLAGNQLHRTKQGKAAGIVLRHETRVTACTLNGTTIFEARRQEAAAVALSAELFAPDGHLFRVAPNALPVGFRSGSGLQLGGTVLERNTFGDCAVGILITTKAIGQFGANSIAMGVGAGIAPASTEWPDSELMAAPDAMS